MTSAKSVEPCRSHRRCRRHSCAGNAGEPNPCKTLATALADMMPAPPAFAPCRSLRSSRASARRLVGSSVLIAWGGSAATAAAAAAPSASAPQPAPQPAPRYASNATRNDAPCDASSSASAARSNAPYTVSSFATADASTAVRWSTSAADNGRRSVGGARRISYPTARSSNRYAACPFALSA
eukprot:31398-Pelagococcus_subviridis.AAC.10